MISLRSARDLARDLAAAVFLVVAALVEEWWS